MSFDDEFRDADAVIVDAFGDSGRYIQSSTGSVFETPIILDRDLKVLSEDGYSTVTQTHASLLKPSFGCEQGDVIEQGAEHYRVVGPLSDDSSMVTLVVSKISGYDLQRLLAAAPVLNQVLTEGF